jgi:iron(III) transport system substrate-binding protein
MYDPNGTAESPTRRRFLRAAAAAGIVGMAGCNTPGNGGTATETETGNGGGGDGESPEQIGSGRSPFGDREVGGTSMAEMPDLEGELTLYSGRGEALVGELIAFIEDRYPDLTIRPLYNSAAELVSQLETEGQNSPADVFYSVNAGALGALADRGRTQPSRTTSAGRRPTPRSRRSSRRCGFLKASRPPASG